MAEERFAQRAYELAQRVQEVTGRAVVGQQRLIQQCLVAVLSGGHVLIEGVPGTAKTLLVRALAIALGKDFKRVQMTPDLMPSDILGTYVFDMEQRQFHLRRGPIFTQFLLADEINRAPAKTQSALLEGMQEKQVTIDGKPHPLDRDFTVFATQNPVEFEGTYPLPEAQVDRFMLKLIVDYPAADQEHELLRRFDQGFSDLDLEAAGVQPVTTPEEILSCRQEIEAVHVSDDVLGYIIELARATREHPLLTLGCSPRAAVMLLLVSKTLAALRGKDYLGPDEVQAMAPPTWRHRLLLRPEAEIEGQKPDDIIASIIASVPVPR
ncbi:MAG: MoxR family ATPase [Armatimonadetes bacterium]|nr:MoxR family ATPase [Armatimonadota bacterium]